MKHIYKCKDKWYDLYKKERYYPMKLILETIESFNAAPSVKKAIGEDETFQVAFYAMLQEVASKYDDELENEITYYIRDLYEEFTSYGVELNLSVEVDENYVTGEIEFVQDFNEKLYTLEDWSFKYDIEKGKMDSLFEENDILDHIEKLIKGEVE